MIAASFAIHTLIDQRRPEIAALCRRYAVRRLEVFGSAARGTDFDPATSDADFLVDFDPPGEMSPLRQFFGLTEDLEALLGRKVDLAERKAVEDSRNYILRNAILAGAEPIYGGAG